TVRFGVPQVLVSVATIALTVAAAVLTSPLVAVALLIGVPLLVPVTRWYLKRATPGYLAERESYAGLNGAITETIEGARTVDALSLGQHRRDRIDAALRNCFEREKYTLGLRTVLFPVAELSFWLPVAGVLLWGGWLSS